MAKEDGVDHGGHLRVDRSPYPLQHAAPAFHPHRRAHVAAAVLSSAGNRLGKRAPSTPAMALNDLAWHYEQVHGLLP
jgi:hypothetical protein